MPYELMVSWRYLYRQKRSSIAMRLLFVFVVVGMTGLSLFIWSGWQAFGAIWMAVGAIGSVTAILALMFSAFTTISILGLALGVATLTWVLAVTSGFHEQFRQKVLGVNAHVIVLKYGVDFAEYRDVMVAAEEMSGVRAAAPFVFNEMMIAKGNRLSGVLVKGVDPKRVGRVLDLPQHIAHAAGGPKPDDLSSLLTSSQDAAGRLKARVPGVIVGKSLAEKLRAKVGDPVRLISPLASLDAIGWMPGQAEMPRTRDFRVTAVFDSGFAEYDKRLIYVDLGEAQAFFDHGDVVTGVELKIEDVFAAKKLAAALSKKLELGRYRTVDWSELNRNLFTALQMQKLVLQLLIGFMVVVAAFNVLAALAVLVIRKTKEIAILRSIGMSARGVARIFQSAGVIIWAFGCTIGLVWGYLGAMALQFYRFPLDPKVYLINELPVRFQWHEAALTALFALIVCLIATLYPSLRAARLHPVQGLRFQ